MADRYGAHGLRLHELAHGHDARPVDPDQARKGISAETTSRTTSPRARTLEDRLWPLCEKVAPPGARRRDGGAGGDLKLKTADFRIVTRRRTLPAPTQTARTLFGVGRELLAGEAGGASYRPDRIGIADLVDADGAPEDLFAGEETRARKGERAVDALRAKFGAAAVVSPGP
ncbi:MAG: hypothetical protein WDM92_15800 [Caulobacteraceae bacterium]